MAQKLDDLYYEIEARTTGFEQSLDEAGRRVEKLADFIKRKPGIAAAAAVAAIVSIGAAATKMAADVDREGRKLGDVFPRVARQAEMLSNEFGVAQTNVLKLYKTIQDRGVAEPEGLTAAATAALQLNQALRGTPEQLEALSNSLGDVRDLFKIDASQSGSLAATLFAMTDGKVPMQDFLGDLAAAAPTIREFGLSLNDVGPELIRFRQEGLGSSRQVATALRQELALGSGALQTHADAATEAAGAQAKFADQLTRTGTEIGVSADKIKERFNNALIDLGTKILPTVTKAMENLVALLDKATGRQGVFDSLDTLIALPIDPNKRLGDSGRRAATSAFRNVQEQISDGDFSLSELGQGQLEALQRTLRGLNAEFANAPEMRREIAAMNTEITRLLTAQPATSGDPGSQHGAGTLESRIQGLRGSLGGLIDYMTNEALRVIPQVVAAVNNAMGAQAEFDKQMRNADDEGRELKAGARAAAAKEADQLGDALHRIKEEAGSANRNTAEMAHLIGGAVEGTLDLANAFGVVDDATQAVLSNIGQIASSLPGLVDALDAVQGKESGFKEIAGVIGASLPIVGGIAALVSGMFGESPEEKARRAAMVQNTKAIEELTREVGNLGLPGVTGGEFATARDAVASLGGRNLNRFKETELTSHGPEYHVAQGNLEAALKLQGTSRQELQDLAKSLGLSVNFITDDFKTLQNAFTQLGKALAQVELTKFAASFDGQMQAFQASLNLLDVEAPIEKLTRLMHVLGSAVGSPALTQILSGVDVTSASGRAEADRRIQALFDQLTKGTLDPAALGGLTGDQFLGMLQEIENLLDQIGGGDTAGGESQSWVVNRSITEVRGTRIESALGTVALYGQETAENTAIIADVISRMAIASGILVPPAPPSGNGYLGGTGGGGVNVRIEQLVIQLPAGADPQLAGKAAAGAFVSELDAQLGERGVTRNQWGGSA